MAYIGVQPAAGQYRKLDDISAGFNGTSTTFTTSVSGENVTAGTAQQLLVSVGGVIQEPKTDYDVSTNSIVFTTAPAVGLDFFAVLMGDAVNTITVPDGSVTTAKLAGSLSVGLAGGTNSAPTLFFTGDTNTGIYSPGADQVAISTNGTQRVTVDTAATTSTLPVVHPLGAVGTPSITFTGDLNTGFWSPAADTVAASTGGSERLRITSAGLVGVGTGSPSTNTEINAALDTGASLGLNEGQLSIGREANSGGAIRIGYDTTNNFGFISSGRVGVSWDKLILNAGGGNVGIGTSSPAGLLHLSSTFGTTLTTGFRIDGTGTTTNNVAPISFYTQSSNWGTQHAANIACGNLSGTDGGGYLRFSTSPDGNTAPSERLRITAAGLVGIGTTTPATSLHLLGANTAGRGQLSVAGNAADPRITLYRDGAFIGAMYGDTTNGVSIAAETGYSITFNPGGASEKARFDSSGRLLVGTSSASDSGALLKVQGNTGGSTGAGWLEIRRGTTTPASGGQLALLSFADASGNQYADIQAFVDGTPGTNDYPGRLVFTTTADGASSPTERMRISSTGGVRLPDVYNQTIALSANVFIDTDGTLKRATSSIKYKTNVETLEDQYADAVLNCRPVWYQSTSAGDNPNWGFWGFIAEEVAEIDPRLVQWKTVEQVTNEDGSRNTVPLETPEPENVAYDRFVPHLLNLIKRQQQAIENLQAEVAALKTQ